MCPFRIESRWPVLAVAIAVLSIAAPVCAQVVDDEASPDQIVEAYMARLGLRDALAAQLRTRLETASGDEKVEIAERLGSIYAELLSTADTAEEQRELEALSRELLESSPRADSGTLRVNLAKARFLLAEREVGRWRLGLADDESVAASNATFAALITELDSIADRVDRQVRALEDREARGGGSDLAALRQQLGEARQLRSLSKFYLGWSRYYSGLLTDQPEIARAALRDFGYLLNSLDSVPEISDVPRSLLRFNHVAGAMLGVALTHSLTGRHDDAVRWLRELETADALGPAVARQMFAQRSIVLAGARRWDALAVALEDRRGARVTVTDRTPAESPLDPAEARLIAVLGLRALTGSNASSVTEDAVQPIIAAALDDLIARGRAADVIDLSREYGTLPLGDTGFIVRYVRALSVYDDALNDFGEPGDIVLAGPMRDAFSDAVDLLAAAFDAEDASNYGTERAACGLRLATTLLALGRPGRAGERFMEVAAFAQGPQREQALWLAVAAFDRAVVDGESRFASQRDTVATVYLSEYPDGERAARLLLSMDGASSGREEAAIETLLLVEPTSPLYDAAQRELTAALYRVYRRSPESDRAGHAARFLRVAERLIRVETEALERADGDEAEAIARGLLAAGFRVIEVALTKPPPEPDRAAVAAASIDLALERAGDSLRAADREVDGKLLFHRLRIATLRGQPAEADRLLTRLETLGGAGLDAAARFLFNRALGAFRDAESPSTSDAARRLIRHGMVIYTNAGGREAIGNEQVAFVADVVAEAAASLYEEAGDPAMRDLAFDLDRAAFDSGLRTASGLRRLGRIASASGNPGTALAAWRAMLAAVPDGGDLWFEARTESIEILRETEPDAARAALAQTVALYPGLGPEPFRTRLLTLCDALGVERPLNEGGDR